MTLRVNSDLAFAAFLVALGAFAFALASAAIGTAAAMGPTCRAGSPIIMVYGAVLGLRAAFTGRQAFPVIAWRPLLLISAAVAVRGAVADRRSGADSLAVVICSDSPLTTCGCVRTRFWRSRSRSLRCFCSSRCSDCRSRCGRRWSAGV
jgi:hypothetical protein